MKFNTMQSNTILIIILVTSFAGITRVNAAPFIIHDARSLSMGSIGVVSGARYAQFNNPALLPFDIPFIAWHLSLSGGRVTTDPDDFEKALGDFQSAASLLGSSPTPANANLANTELGKLVDKKFDEIEVKSFSISIPSKVLGGAIFFNKYVIKTARANVGNVDLSVPSSPSFNSTLEKRGLSIIEQGVSFAQVINEEGRGFDAWAYGFSPKLVFAKTSTASDTIQSADTNINFSGASTNSSFNVDIGLLKEFGRYKFGAVIKNLIPMELEFPNGEKIKIKPQLRAGFGYAKRKSSWEINLDLTPNDGVVFTNESAYLSMGTEFKLTRSFRLRAGYRQNLQEDNDATLSVGLGMGSSYRLDIAAFKGNEEAGAIGQLGIDF